MKELIHYYSNPPCWFCLEKMKLLHNYINLYECSNHLFPVYFADYSNHLHLKYVMSLSIEEKYILYQDQNGYCFVGTHPNNQPITFIMPDWFLTSHSYQDILDKFNMQMVFS